MNRLLGSGWQEAGWAPALGSGDVRTNVEASTAAASMRKMGDVICSFTDESTVASLLSAVVAQPETVGEQHPDRRPQRHRVEAVGGQVGWRGGEVVDGARHLAVPFLPGAARLSVLSDLGGRATAGRLAPCRRAQLGW